MCEDQKVVWHCCGVTRGDGDMDLEMRAQTRSWRTLGCHEGVWLFLLGSGNIF